jgi:hypothetical protein
MVVRVLPNGRTIPIPLNDTQYRTGAPLILTRVTDP